MIQAAFFSLCLIAFFGGMQIGYAWRLMHEMLECRDDATIALRVIDEVYNRRLSDTGITGKGVKL